MDRTDYAGSKKRVVILGGGFGGAYAAMALNKILPKDWEYTLIDRNNFLLFYPLLVEAGVGTIEPRHVVVPIRDFVRGRKSSLPALTAGLIFVTFTIIMISALTHDVLSLPMTIGLEIVLGLVTLFAMLGTAETSTNTGDFRMAEITAVDLEMQQVRFRMVGALAQSSLHYDHLIFGMGSVTKMPPVRGLAEHGYQLKSLADSISLRDRAIRLLELANTVDETEVRRALLRFVVVGANFTGIELAGEYQDFLTDAVRSYSNIDRDDVSVVVIELSDRILSAIDSDLADYARKHLEKRGLEIRTNLSVHEVNEDHVVLTDGSSIATYTCIWAAGIAPSPVLDRVEGLPRDRGWIQCDSDLRVRGHKNVWAVGDLAKIDDPNYRSPGATAQVAVRQGTHIARNIERLLEHEETLPFEYSPVGSLAALGCRTAVAKVFGIKVSGIFAWWLFRTVYLMKMPSWSRRVRIVLDWTTELFFRRDIVQLGVPRVNPSRPDLPVLEKPIETDQFAEHRAAVSDR